MRSFIRQALHWLALRSRHHNNNKTMLLYPTGSLRATLKMETAPRARLVIIKEQAAEEHVGAIERRSDLARLGGNVALAEHKHLDARQPPRRLPRGLRSQVAWSGVRSATTCSSAGFKRVRVWSRAPR